MRPNIFLATIGRGSNGSNALEVTEDRAAVTAESQDNIINRVNNVSQYGPSWHYVPGIGVAGTAYAEVPGSALGDLVFTRASSKTRTNAAGLIQSIGNNVPPHDYRNADGTLSTFPRLNLEPQRINSMLYSQAINSWAFKTELTITDNNTISPDGTQNASYIQQTTGGNSVVLQSQTVSVTAGQVQTVSFFAKAKEVTSVSFRLGGVTVWSGGVRPTFTCDLTNGTITLIAGTATVSSQNIGNGWYRFVIVTSAVLITTTTTLQTPTGAVFSPTSGAGFYLWGVQWEQNAAYPTTYIPTTTAAVTRIADAASKTGVSSLIGQTEGTIFLDFNNRFLLSYPSETVLRIDGTTSAHQIFLRKEGASSTYTARLIVSSSTIWTFSGIVIPNGNNKIAIAYKSANSAIYLNGTQVGTTNTSSFSGSVFDNVYLNNAGANNPELPLAQAALIKTRLTNAQLAQLTTL